MKKILLFLVLALAVLGLLGGIGYAIYGGSYPIAVGIAVLGYLAYPQAKKIFENMFSSKE